MISTLQIKTLLPANVANYVSLRNSPRCCCAERRKQCNRIGWVQTWHTPQYSHKAHVRSANSIIRKQILHKLNHVYILIDVNISLIITLNLKTSYFLTILPLVNSCPITIFPQPLKDHEIPHRNTCLYALYTLILRNLHYKGRSGTGVPILHKVHTCCDEYLRIE